MRWLVCDYCPMCAKEGLKVKMIYDPQREECYCPRCGYSEEHYTVILPIYSDDNIQTSLTSVIQNDKGLGSHMDVNDIKEIMKVGFNKDISYTKATIFKVGYDTKSYKEGKTQLEILVNCINNTFDIRIPKYIIDDIVYYAGKIIRSTYNKKNKKYYKIFEIYVIVLYHLMIVNFLHLHKKEILDMITTCIEDTGLLPETKNQLKSTISRRYTRLQNVLPKFNVSMKDKIIAVAKRFGVPPIVAIEFFEFIMNKIDISKKYDKDNMVFAGIFFLKKEINGEEIDTKLMSSGIKTLYSVIKEVVPEFYIDRLKLQSKQLKRLKQDSKKQRSNHKT